MSSKSRFIAVLFASIVVFGLSNSTFGQIPSGTTGAPSPAKIGIINIQEAITNTEEGKREFLALQQRFAPKQEELKKENEEVESLKKQLSDPINISDEQRKTISIKLETKLKAFQRDYEDVQAEFQRSEQEAVNRIGERMIKIVETYAKSHGFTVILDASSPQTGVIWSVETSVITKDVVAAYNTQFPITGTSSPKKPGDRS